MTLLKIAQFGHPVLLQRARPITLVDSDDVQQLIDDMIETMEDAGGVGLAAPQVYRSLRLFVAKRVDLGEEMDKTTPFAIVNPEIEGLGEATALGFEGCLSIPGMRGLVPRFERIAYRGLDRFGQAIEGECEGFFARILQHEYDHLDGILYPARLADWRHMGVNPEIERLAEYLHAADKAPDQ